jgi:hypothetical protein
MRFSFDLAFSLLLRLNCPLPVIFIRPELRILKLVHIKAFFVQYGAYHRDQNAGTS